LNLHLALANGITSNPAKLCSLSIQGMKLLNQNNNVKIHILVCTHVNCW
jgi:hypothetical protein